MLLCCKCYSVDGILLLQCDVQVIVTDAGETDVDKLEYQKSAYVAVALILAITAVAVLFPLIVTSHIFNLNTSIFSLAPPPPCNDSCRFVLSCHTVLCTTITQRSV